MSDDGFEIFHANADVKLLFYFEVFEIKVVYGDGSLQWLLEHVYMDLVAKV